MAAHQRTCRAAIETAGPGATADIRRASVPREIVTPAATTLAQATATPSTPSTEPRPSPASIPTTTDVTARRRNPSDRPRPTAVTTALAAHAPAPNAATAGPRPINARPIVSGSPTWTPSGTAMKSAPTTTSTAPRTTIAHGDPDCVIRVTPGLSLGQCSPRRWRTRHTTMSPGAVRWNSSSSNAIRTDPRTRPIGTSPSLRGGPPSSWGRTGRSTRSSPRPTDRRSSMTRTASGESVDRPTSRPAASDERTTVVAPGLAEESLVLRLAHVDRDRHAAR